MFDFVIRIKTIDKLQLYTNDTSQSKIFLNRSGKQERVFKEVTWTRISCWWIEKEYDSKTEKINKLIESLDKKMNLIIRTVNYSDSFGRFKEFRIFEVVL